MAEVKRGRGRPPGTPASDKQKAAGKQNLRNGHTQRKAAAKQRRAQTKAVEKTRHQQLMDGDITLKDLTMEELARGRCAHVDGSFEGRAPKMPANILVQMEGERIRRIKLILKKAGPEAAENIVELMDHENGNVGLAATKYILEHNIGKVPEVVHVGTETAWDRLSQDSAFAVVATDEEDVEWEDENDGKSGTEVVVSE